MITNNPKWSITEGGADLTFAFKAYADQAALCKDLSPDCRVLIRIHLEDQGQSVPKLVQTLSYPFDILIIANIAI